MHGAARFVGLAISVFIATTVFVATSTQANTDITVVMNPAKRSHLDYVTEFQRYDLQSKKAGHLRVISYDKGCSESDDRWVVAVGAESLRACLDIKRHKNIIAVLVTYNALDNLQRQYRYDGIIPAIVLDQPLIRHIDFIKTLLPNTESITVLVDDVPNQNAALDQLKAQYHVDIRYLALLASSFAQTTVDELVKRNSVIVALPKSEARSGEEAKWLLYLEYKNKIPVFGFSADYVRAGAVGAVYSTADQIAKQTREWLDQNVIHNGPKLSKTEFPKYYHLDINETVVSSLDLHNEFNKNLVKQIEDGRIPFISDKSPIQYVGDTI